jgi:hypothetical protein
VFAREGSGINPNVAYPRRGKTRRLGQDEQYLTVREILSEASTLADGALSRERSDFYRFGYTMLGLKVEDTYLPMETCYFKVAFDAREFNHLPGALGEGHPYSQG